MAPFSEFKKLGIPGPAPWPFVGNLPEYSKKVFVIISVVVQINLPIVNWLILSIVLVLD